MATLEQMRAAGQGGALPHSDSPRATARKATVPDPRAFEIGVDALSPDPDQPRRTFDSEAIESLAESFRIRGQMTPIRVRPMTADRWWIIAGERRWRAALVAPLDSLRAIEAPAGMSADEVLLDQLTENVQREALDAEEEARAYQLLLARGESQRELARRSGIPQARIAQRIALLGLPPEILEDVKTAKIPASSAYLISTAPPERQPEIAQAVVQGGASRREVMQLVDRAKGRVVERKREITTKAGIVVTCERSRPFTAGQLRAALLEAAGSLEAATGESAAA